MSAAYHQPVLVQEVCAALLPPLLAAHAPVLVDCTTGGAGHTTALLQALAAQRPSDAIRPRCIGLDRDPAALAFARARLETIPFPVELIHAPFSRLADRIYAAAPQTGRGGRGEGSVLGGLGRLLDGDNS